MNKVLKCLVAVVSAAAMAIAGFAGAASAMADTPAKTDITISDAVNGDEFSAYRLLDLTTSTESETTNYSYTVNDKYQTVLQNAIDELNGDAAAPTTDAGIIDYITNNVVSNGSSDVATKVTARKFAETVRTKIAADSTIKEDTKSHDAQFTGVDQGYYLIVQTKATSADGQTMSQVILDTHGQITTTVRVKKDTVSLTKKVHENQDGVDDPAEDNWQDGADYNIGDLVTFKLTGTLPTDYGNYNAYKYVFHDSASTGLTFNVSDAELKVYAVNSDTKGETRTELRKATDASDKTGYNVITTGLTGETFQVQFTDLKKAQANEGTVTINKDTEIVVEYKAKLNEKANRGAAGNPNQAWLEFSNDQYRIGEGSPTGNTPHDKVIVFTFDIVVNKYKKKVDEKHKLNNAGFTLYKSTDNGVSWTPAQELKNGANDNNVFQFKGLDSGYYKIVESKVPDGFTKADDLIFKVVATYDKDSDNPRLNDNGLQVQDMQGTPISGDQLTFTISAQDGSANAQINTNIVNQSSSQLPSTGGMGTTILYAAGAAIVLVAAFGIVFAVRRRNAR